MIDINITGLSELQAQLDRLPANVEKKLLRGALRAGQKVVLEAAKANIRTISGDLAASLRISTRSRKNGLVSARVVAGAKKVFYAHMVEFGTAQHYIKPKTRRSLFFAGINAEVIDHPGAKKHPFMRPAIDGAADAAMQAFANYLSGRITSELDKLPDEADGVTT